MALPREEFLRVFPHADPDKNRFQELESWMDSRYEPASAGVNLSGYRLMKRKGGEFAARVNP